MTQQRLARMLGAAIAAATILWLLQGQLFQDPDPRIEIAGLWPLGGLLLLLSLPHLLAVVFALGALTRWQYAGNALAAAAGIWLFLSVYLAAGSHGGDVEGAYGVYVATVAAVPAIGSALVVSAAVVAWRAVRLLRARHEGASPPR